MSRLAVAACDLLESGGRDLELWKQQTLIESQRDFPTAPVSLPLPPAADNRSWKRRTIHTWLLERWLACAIRLQVW
jgi:hypothetical protein